MKHSEGCGCLQRLWTCTHCAVMFSDCARESFLSGCEFAQDRRWPVASKLPCHFHYYSELPYMMLLYSTACMLGDCIGN